MQTIKSLKLLLIALVVCGNLFSQSNIYKPFPQTYGSWIVYKQGPLGPGLGSVSSWKKYEAFGDTTIGSYTYKKVTVANNTGYPTWNGTTYVIPFGASTFTFGYRNDVAAKKVYYLDVTAGVNKDTLWYDFNLNIGDTIKNNFSFLNPFGYNSNLRRIVYSIDSVLNCGTYYKRFNFNCSPSSFETELIEGIGYKDRFTSTNYPDCPFEPSYIYSTSFSICNITSVEEYLRSNIITLTPNPTNYELKINASVPLTYYVIVNTIGTVVLKGNLIDTQSINVSSLASGLYVIAIQDKSGKSYQSKFIKQ